MVHISVRYYVSSLLWTLDNTCTVCYYCTIEDWVLNSKSVYIVVQVLCPPPLLMQGVNNGYSLTSYLQDIC